MKDFTDITVLLDRSGSMSSIRILMEMAIDKLVEEHKSVESTKLTLIQFDDQNKQEIVFQAVPITAVEKVRITPRGSTPLIDAFCTAIDRTGLRFASMHESDRPARVLMIIITDGMENASNQFKRTDVFNRVTKQRNDYKWEFIYLGANQDTFAESQSYGISWGNTLKFSPDEAHIAFMAQNLASASSSFSNTGVMRGYTSQDRVKSASLEDLSKDTNPDVSNFVDATVKLAKRSTKSK